MKKALTIILVAVLVFSMVGCASKETDASTLSKMEEAGVPSTVLPEGVNARFNENVVSFNTKDHDFAELQDFYRKLIEDLGAKVIADYGTQELIMAGIAQSDMFDSWLYNGVFKEDSETPMAIYISMQESMAGKNTFVSANISVQEATENDLQMLASLKEAEAKQNEIEPSETSEVTTQNGATIQELEREEAGTGDDTVTDDTQGSQADDQDSSQETSE